MNEIICYTRFNRLPDPDRVRRTITNPLWWEKRIELLKNTLIKSLDNQTHQNFRRWAVFTNLITDGYYLEAQEKIKALGFEIKIDPYPNDTIEFYPYKPLVFENIGKDVVTVGIDSDDLIDRGVMEKIAKHDFTEGEVLTFGDGYLYDTNSKKMYIFKERGGHLPFIVYFITQEAQKDYETLLGYMNKWKMNVHHYNVNKAPKATQLFQNDFLVTTHGSNTTTRIGNVNVDKRLGLEVSMEKALRILKDTGYAY